MRLDSNPFRAPDVVLFYDLLFSSANLATRQRANLAGKLAVKVQML